MGGVYFAYMGRRNPLTDWAQFFLGERYPWHNQACQIWWPSLKGFRGSCGSNFSISHWLCWSSLQHSHTTVWACDTASWMFLCTQRMKTSVEFQSKTSPVCFYLCSGLLFMSWIAREFLSCCSISLMSDSVLQQTWRLSAHVFKAVCVMTILHERWFSKLVTTHTNSGRFNCSFISHND